MSIDIGFENSMKQGEQANQQARWFNVQIGEGKQILQHITGTNALQ